MVKLPVLNHLTCSVYIAPLAGNKLKNQIASAKSRLEGGTYLSTEIEGARREAEERLKLERASERQELREGTDEYRDKVMKAGQRGGDVKNLDEVTEEARRRLQASRRRAEEQKHRDLVARNTANRRAINIAGGHFAPPTMTLLVKCLPLPQ